MLFTLVCFLALVFFGVPIVLALGFATTILVLVSDTIPIQLLAHRFYSGLNNFTLLAIPFFVLSGLLMEAGGLSRRIVDFASALVGWIRGGLLMVAVLAATALAAMSGSGSADTAAVSAVLQPELKRRNYNIDFSAALIAAAGSLAQIIPPSLMLVVIAVQNNLSVGALFLAGIVPGALASGALLVVAYAHARRDPNIAASVEAFELRRVVKTFIAAVPALGMAVIITGGILGGFMTPTEAAGISVVYALLIGFFVYRDLRLRDVGPIIIKAAAFTASLLLLVATANIFNFIVADSGVLEATAIRLEFILGSKFAFLLFANVLLMTLGMFIEGLAIILLLGTILIQFGVSLGIDPNHMALVIVLNCAIGLITPPFGATLFVAALIAERPFEKVARRVFFPWLAMTLSLVIVTAFPEVSLGLPRMFGFLE